MSKRRVPPFTIEELRSIHQLLRDQPWQPDLFYNERRSAFEKLSKFLDEEQMHLQEETE